MDKGSFDSVNWWEFATATAVSAGVGMIKVLQIIRARKQFRWIDALFEPAIAVFAGLLVWGLGEWQSVPDVLQSVLTSLGAWGGPRTIHKLERKYLGGTRSSDFTPLDDARGR